MLELLREPPPAIVEPAPITNGVSAAAANADDRPGDRFEASTTWKQLLLADGASIVREYTTGQIEWARPGKDQRQGSSATTGRSEADNLHVFSTNWHGLNAGENYTRFNYYAATRHGGDRHAAARALSAEYGTNSADDMDAWRQHVESSRATAEGGIVVGVDGGIIVADPYLAKWQIDWAKLWTEDNSDELWLCEPFLAKGKQHAIYAGAKTGKSLIMLEICAALATGREVLSQSAGLPISIVYVDFEMTGSDVRERMFTFGYGPQNDMSNLHYILLPSIAGIDTREGGAIVHEAARDYAADLVVVDTTARAVEGPENDADTFRAVYRHTGLGLKSAGITFARLDHSGKDLSRGQRGSSAKNDDVDIVWQLANKDAGVKRFTATHRRVMWVPESFDVRIEDDDGVERHVVTGGKSFPAGTAECLEKLAELDLPFDAGVAAARKAAIAAGVKLGASAVLNAAIRERKTPEYQLREFGGLL